MVLTRMKRVVIGDIHSAILQDWLNAAIRDTRLAVADESSALVCL
jgi:hypothetical protein